MGQREDHISKKCEGSGNDASKMDEEEDISFANVYREVQSQLILICS